MSNCCAKPRFRIIKIGGIEVGIKGLDQAFDDICSTNEQDPNKLKDALLTKIKEYGNYVAPSREDNYKQDILNEYNKFCASLQRVGEPQKDIKEPGKPNWLSFKRGKK